MAVTVAITIEGAISGEVTTIVLPRTAAAGKLRQAWLAGTQRPRRELSSGLGYDNIGGISHGHLFLTEFGFDAEHPILAIRLLDGE